MALRVALLAALVATALAECDNGPKGPTPDGVNEARNLGKPNCNNQVEKMEDPDGTWVTAGQKKPVHSPQKVQIPDGKSVDPNKHVAEKPPSPDKEVAIITDSKGKPQDVTVIRNEDGLPVEPCVYCDTKEARARRAAPPAPKGPVGDTLSVIPGVNVATGNEKKKSGPSGAPHEAPKWYVITDPSTSVQRLYSESKLDNTCPNGCSGQGKCIKGVCYCLPGQHCDDCSCKRCPNDCSGKGYCNLHTGSCKCLDGFVNDDCSAYDMFKATNCSGHGSSGGNGECVCNPGWSGTKCDKRTCIGGCNEKNGVCDEGRCFCRDGWRGVSCETRTCPRQCSQLGTCDATTGKCNCMPGTYGDDCSRGEPLEPPEPSPCEKKTCGKGRCNVDTGDCECLKGWFGYDCSQSECTKTDAFGTPLKDCGHGVCKITPAGAAVCECQPGWKKADAASTKCDVIIAGCQSNCTATKKQGKCLNAIEKCFCAEGFAGDDCAKPKPRFCSDECSKTCVSLCVLNGKAGAANSGGKIDMADFGNNVHCLESCNGRCFADCMSHGVTEERGKVDGALAHKSHVGEDSDILPSQMARAANGDLKADEGALAGKGASPVKDTGAMKDLAALKSSSAKANVAADVDIKAAKDQDAKNLQHRSNPGRPDPKDMPNGTPPPEE